jgi:hypothetical protein
MAEAVKNTGVAMGVYALSFMSDLAQGDNSLNPE